MHDLLETVAGERLIGDDYWHDFDENFWKIGDPGFWKLERLQTFQEPADDSWVAFSDGDWTKAMRLLERRRANLEGHYRRMARHGFKTWRVRVVEKPITPYLQWELHLLKLRHELGGSTRVIGLRQVEECEREQALPEIITLGNNVMYQLLYDDTGLQEGGIRITDRRAVRKWRDFIKSLYEDGESLTSYFAREVATLPVPHGN